ncbi:MAG: DUF3800 domain-containing protein [Thermodesulfobacteriota bacterium]
MSSQYLYVFLDEAGDFNFSVSGTRFFTLTTITKSRPFPWDAPLISLKYDLIEVGLDIEYFHAAEDRQAVRDRVFSIIADNLIDLRIDTLIVEKAKTGPSLQVVEKFYPRMIGYLIRYVLEKRNLRNYTEVIVMTDSIPVSRKREAIEKAVKQTLSRMLPAGAKYRILHHASKSCVGLQIADYCNWAIFRKWERGDLRSYELIRSGIWSEFDIFKSGTRHYY